MLKITLTSAPGQSSGLVSVLWDDARFHGQLQAVTTRPTFPTSVPVTSGKWLKLNISLVYRDSWAWAFLQPMWMGFWVNALPLPELSGAELRCRTTCKPDWCWLDLDWRVGSEVMEMDHPCMEGAELYQCWLLKNILPVSARENCLCFLCTGNYSAKAAGRTSVSRDREKPCCS